ncbi:TPA: hypothetical protein MNK97_005592 [Klebsiella pneumoniae]|nr:hypothetical protein [Klebsiella pneumoniae]
MDATLFVVFWSIFFFGGFLVVFGAIGLGYVRRWACVPEAVPGIDPRLPEPLLRDMDPRCERLYGVHNWHVYQWKHWYWTEGFHFDNARRHPDCQLVDPPVNAQNALPRLDV